MYVLPKSMHIVRRAWRIDCVNRAAGSVVSSNDLGYEPDILLLLCIAHAGLPFLPGSIPSVSVITLLVRRQKFKKYLRHAPQHFQSALEDDNEAGASSSARTKNDQRNQKGDGRGSNDGHTSKPKNESPQIGSNALPRKQTYDRGGFPNPIIALYHSASSQLRQRYLSPSSKLGHHSSENHHKKREYLSFDHRSRVHRNSHFPDLSGEERSEIGQLELRAMTLLVGIMLGYMLVLQLFAVIIWAPYFSAGHYTDPDFVSGFETSRTW
jgi:hypothetical protein